MRSSDNSAAPVPWDESAGRQFRRPGGKNVVDPKAPPPYHRAAQTTHGPRKTRPLTFVFLSPYSAQFASPAPTVARSCTRLRFVRSNCSPLTGPSAWRPAYAPPDNRVCSRRFRVRGGELCEAARCRWKHADRHYDFEVGASRVVGDIPGIYARSTV